MLKIEKKFIVDENNQKLAVEVDIKTFEQMEEIIENYGLVQLMKETESEEALSLSEAKEFYSKLKK